MDLQIWTLRLRYLLAISGFDALQSIWFGFNSGRTPHLASGLSTALAGPEPIRPALPGDGRRADGDGCEDAPVGKGEQPAFVERTAACYARRHLRRERSRSTLVGSSGTRDSSEIQRERARVRRREEDEPIWFHTAQEDVVR
jgi:hypothetical protein